MRTELIGIDTVINGLHENGEPAAMAETITFDKLSLQNFVRSMLWGIKGELVTEWLIDDYTSKAAQMALMGEAINPGMFGEVLKLHEDGTASFVYRKK